ncbi:hypothetical protein [Pararhodobacter aggregans]|uniref:hypothetical protein n=1 Tax=Pararhodobacter aggregans TaxID=404875 RepID=UPI003A943ED1
MNVRIDKPALILREELARLAGLEQRTGAVPPTALGYAGDGTTKTFACRAGHQPGVVWKDGVMQRQGPGDAYVVSYDGFTHKVVFAVAPAVAARVDILQWRV